MIEIQSSPLRLFEDGQLGYAIFRIPGIVRTASGSLLAYCEARQSWSDWGDIDIWLRRSLDGGRSWQPAVQVNTRHPDVPPNPVSSKVEGAAGQTCGSPVMIAGPGIVHLVYCVENYRCFYRRSLDDGQTWSAPRDITTAFDEIRPRYPWRVFATGPGHGIRLWNGRLLVTAWLSTGEGSGGHRPSAVTTLFSDDSGESWHTGEIVVSDGPTCANPSESVAVEIPSSRPHAPPTVLLNIRSETPIHRRLVTTSADGVSGWSAPQYHPDLFEPVCSAGLVAGENFLAFSNPDSSDAKDEGGLFFPRRSLKVRLSPDQGRTWPEAFLLDPGPAGYSDLAAGPAGEIHCLYEQGNLLGNHFAPESLTFVTLQARIDDPELPKSR